MQIQCVVGVNYVDCFSLHPFEILACSAYGWKSPTMSRQTFPCYARRVDNGLTNGYTATLWALETGRPYTVDFMPFGVVDASMHEEHATCGCGGNEVERHGERVVVVKMPICGKMRLSTVLTTVADDGPLSSFGSIAILDHTLLSRDEFLDCLRSQTGDYMYISVHGISVETVLHRLFYHSLFGIPTLLRGTPIFALPNGASGRFCIDFQNECSWGKSRKVRRAVSSQRYAVAVNRDIRNSLQLAKKYHSANGNTTWLNDQYIDVLVTMANRPQFGVRIMSVELVEKKGSVVLAGCLSFAVGALFHDFTMFTIRRTTEGFGAIITKVLGDALQECRYNLWYWGFRLEYMSQFEDKYGGRNIGKEEFLQRWGNYRNVQPCWTVEEYFRSGRGMLPYFEHSV